MSSSSIHSHVCLNTYQTDPAKVDKSDGFYKAMSISVDLRLCRQICIETSSLPPNKNSDRWTRILKMVSYVDWISYYCAIFNGTDPTPVNKIEKLKGLL